MKCLKNYKSMDKEASRARMANTTTLFYALRLLFIELCDKYGLHNKPRDQANLRKRITLVIKMPGLKF